jgi:coproporphyrinogen III oxidase
MKGDGRCTVKIIRRATEGFRQPDDFRQLSPGEGEIGDFPMNGNIFNSQGVHVATVIGSSIFGLRGQKLYDLKGTKIYKLSGKLVGHLANAKLPNSIWTEQQTSCFPPPDLRRGNATR